MHASWISWAVVVAGGGVLWSLMGVDRANREAVRRRLVPGVGLVVIGLASLAVTSGTARTGRAERAVADAFTVAWLSQGRAGAARYLAPDARVLAKRLPATGSMSETDAVRLAVSGLVDACGALPLFQGSGSRCVTYRDGTRVFVAKSGDAWRVVGFTRP